MSYTSPLDISRLDKMAPPSAGGGSLAIGNPVSGAVASQFLGTDGSGNLASVALPSTLVIATSYSGHPTAGVWVTGQATIDANGVAWYCQTGGTPGTWIQGSSGGAVSSVFGRTGAVIAQTGDYTAAQVGADTSGAAATEQTRALAAEALLLPLAGGTMTGAIAMGSHKITGLTNGVASTDAATVGQLPAPAGGLTAVASTGAAGFALTNGTPTILTWTAPNDGNLHYAIFAGSLFVSSSDTGGTVVFTWTDPGSGGSSTLFAAGLAAGKRTPGGTSTMFGATNIVSVSPGTTVAVSQSTALTAGAATVYGAILGV